MNIPKYLTDLEKFDQWWDNLLNEDPEYLEDFDESYEGFKEIAQIAWKARTCSLEEAFRAGFEFGIASDDAIEEALAKFLGKCK